MKALNNTFCSCQLLVVSEQIQCEADDIGPAAELDHWKRRTARFDCLLTEIRNQRVRAVTAALNVLKSKQIKKWKEMVSVKTNMILSLFLLFIKQFIIFNISKEGYV